MRLGWVLLLLAGAALGIGYLVYQTPEPELKPARTGDPNKVTLEPVNFDGLERELVANKGSVVLVEFWATWCGPCRKDFPKLVAIHERYAERGLVCISVSLEKNPEEDRGSALSFLKDQHAAFANFLWTERTPRGRDGLETRFGYPGGIPYAALFGRNGERIVPADGPVFPKLELLAAIEAELEKPKP